MARLVWSKKAKVLKERYVEQKEGRLVCKVCRREIEESENAFKTLNNIYRHFKEEHPDILEKVTAELQVEAAA